VICRRQAVMHHGGSRTTVIPAKAKVSDVVPVAVGARLMLVDLRGEATPEDLAALLEDLVEPALAGRDRFAAAGERRLREGRGKMKPMTRYDRELDVVQAELREARRRASLQERALARIGTGLPVFTSIVGIIAGFLLRQA